MAILSIRIHPDPVLRERALEVAAVDSAVRKLIGDLEETMRAAPGVGLAAPQVGVQRRVLVYDHGEGFHALVNPAILEREGEIVEEEGCLSIPGLQFPVARAERIVVAGLDGDGLPVEYEAIEMHARVLQHEIDHLDGILFIERIAPEQRREARRLVREWAMDPSARRSWQPVAAL